MRISHFKLAKILLALMPIIAIASAACTPGSTPVVAGTGTNIPTETRNPTVTPTLTVSPTVTPTLTARPTVEPTAKTTSTFPPSAQLREITVNGQTFVLRWEASSGTSTVDQTEVPLCLVYYMIKGGGQITFKPVGGECSAEKIIELIETWKSTIPEADNTGEREAFDQFIAELKRYE